MNHSATDDLIPLIVISMLAALLSSMNVWADQWSDIRFSLNDWYMASLMTGWMFLLTGLYQQKILDITIGLFVVTISIFLIRTQFFITETQFFTGMIPHHSMAVFMSKKLLQKDPPLTIEKSVFINNMITAQNTEIDQIKGIYLDE